MITILIPISRPDYLNLIFPMLEALECDQAQTNLLAIVDGDEDLYLTVQDKVQRSKFNERLTVQFKSNRPIRHTSIRERRQRIADIHNFAKTQINNAKYILAIEDDTTFSVHTLQKLYKTYLAHPHAGMIQGYQLGRWGIPYIGAFKVDDPYDPTEIKSMERGQGLEECDTGGFYCMLTKAETYMAHDFKPYEDTLGPDFNYSIDLRKQGYKNYTDFSTPCLHHTKDGIIEPVKTETRQVKYSKVRNKWKRFTL